MTRRFETTNWSLVLAAAESKTPRSQEALAALCEAYWPPVYAFIRGQGCAPEKARDLTQGYFLRLLEKHYLKDVRPEAGRFRSFLCASVKHFLANERDKEQALKRAADRAPLAFDVEAAEGRYVLELADELTPEKVFEKEWAATVLKRALSCLREEFAVAGKLEEFDRLKVYLTGEKPADPYKQVAEDLLITEPAVRVTVHRMRRRFGQLLREEIGHTVATPQEIDDEVRYLLEVIGP